MAEGSKRNYTAVFSIGAKLLGSFKGVMAQAQARLHRLQHTALHTGESILKVFERLGVGLSLFAGFAAGKVFQSIFEGASEEAVDAHRYAQKLSILLLQHNEIRKGGLALAQQQVGLIHQVTEAWQKQGVVGTDQLNNMAAELAVFGYAPKKIAEMIGPLSDVLVTMRGAAATEEDAGALAFAWGKAVKTGMVKPMQQFGFVLDTVAQKNFRSLSAAGRNNLLLAWGKGFRGANLQAASTAIGKIQQFRNEMKEVSEDIGNKLLPAQARMAASWSKLLPILAPYMVKMFSAVLDGAANASDFVKAKLIPAFQHFAAFLKSGPVTKAASTLWQNLKTTGGKIGKAFGDMFKNLSGTNKIDFGAILIGAMKKLADAIKWVGDNASWLVPLIVKLAAAFEIASIAISLASAVMALSPIGWVIIGITALVAGLVLLHEHFGTLTNALSELWEWLKKIPVLGPVLMKVWDDMKGAWQDLKALWEGLMKLWEGAKPTLLAVFGAIGKAIKDNVLAEINAIKEAWNSAVTFIESHLPKWVLPTPQGATGTPPAPAMSIQNYQRSVEGLPPLPPPKPVAAKIPGAATGGIIRGHSLLQVAERGPEAIIPLSGGPRAEGLLNYASRAIGMGGITSNHESHITYAPQYTINGGGSQADQREIQSQMRKHDTEFLARLKAATSQERRLSFDSGYS